MIRLDHGICAPVLHVIHRTGLDTEPCETETLNTSYTILVVAIPLLGSLFIASERIMLAVIYRRTGFNCIV